MYICGVKNTSFSVKITNILTIKTNHKQFSYNQYAVIPHGPTGNTDLTPPELK
jgi:hypothetical protein